MVALCISLFISDSIFLLSNIARSYKNACTCVAILLHFFLLTSHVLTAATAFEFASTFRSRPVARPSKSLKRFVLYCAVAVVCSIIVVLITFILNEIDASYIQYGGKAACWIGNLYGRVFSYIAPVVFVYIFSAVALTYAIRNIHEVNKLNHSAMPKQDKNRYSSGRIAFKLIVYLGIIEIFGIIQISKDNLSNNELIFNSVFQMLFTIIRSFRGVFILMLILSAKKSSWLKSLSTKRIRITLNRNKPNLDTSKCTVESNQSVTTKL
ncbi:adhesion G protein-coupled receptor L2-like [Hydractinia symbiolongicarpus]|uniref:adhesion G protein-coupled receptor L2-like n=1 Tax=Hydractinia symbiolongicarpus TaxID=13093 RepID=UPI00254E07CF|nr:adhesion G protein-coupled receptor L2-like [Hydractinia symbiolongicarpus]